MTLLASLASRYSRGSEVVRCVGAVVVALALAVPAVAQWPMRRVDFNDILEARLRNDANVGIYQRTFAAGAEAACQSDHRDDVRSAFG